MQTANATPFDRSADPVSNGIQYGIGPSVAHSISIAMEQSTDHAASVN